MQRVECTLRVTNMNTVKISGVKLSRSGTTSSNEILFTHNISVFFSFWYLVFSHSGRKSTEKNMINIPGRSFESFYR
jgi:hypothetical protein